MINKISPPFAMLEDVQRFGDGITLEMVSMMSVGNGLAPFEISRFSVAPGHRTDQDRHLSREVWMVAGGYGILCYGSKEVGVSPGDIFFFESNVPHYIENTGDKLLRIFSIWWTQ